MERFAIRSLVVGLLGVLLCASGVYAQDEPSGRLLATGPAAGCHDPTIIRVDGRYLRFSTGQGLPIASSTDLKRWERAGQVFTANPDWTTSAVPGSGDLWAPDIVLRDGVWRIYYAVSTFGSNRSAIGMAVNAHLDTEHPDQGWVDQGPVLESHPSDHFNAIDPQVATDGAGHDWLVYGSFWSGIAMRPLNAKGRLLPQGPTIPLAQRPDAPDAIEGAYLFHHGDWYYLLVSFDFCCRGLSSTYHVRVGRSAHFQGPYEDRGGKSLLVGGGSLVVASEDRDRGPGHPSVLIDGDKDFLVYHTYDARYGGSARGRVAEISWDEQGWPTVPQGPATQLGTP